MKLKKRSAAALALAAVCGAAVPLANARPDVVVPNAFAGTAGGGGLNTILRDTLNPRAYQVIYSGSQLTSVVGQQLTGLKFRLSASQATFPPLAAGGYSWPDYEIRVCTPVNSAAGMSLTFAANLGPNVALVHDGTLSIPDGNFPGGLPLNPFGGEITLQTPWVYTGGDLLLEIRHPGGSFTNPNGFVDGLITTQTAQGYGTLTRAISGTTMAATVGAAATAYIAQLVFTPPTGTLGACCKPIGTCFEGTAATCAFEGGVYQGDGSLCVNTTCPQPPLGACCLLNGKCVDATTFACSGQGGVWQGVLSACAVTPCPQPAACCFIDGTCSNNLPNTMCAAQGGVYQGSGSTCATVTCTVTPPAATVVTLTNCVTSTLNFTLAAGQVQWYSITVPALAAAGPAYLDIDTEGTLTTPTNDTEIGLYRTSGTPGTLVTTDDDDGSNFLSQLSYGFTSPRMPFGNSVAYNGRDGALPAGTYLLAVGGFDSVFNPHWGVTSVSGEVGPYQVRIRLCDTIATGACCRGDGICTEPLTQFNCVTTNGGVYHGDGVLCSAVTCTNAPTVITPSNCATVTTSGTLAAGQVAWYSLTIPAVATPAYLDIDTEGSALTPTNNTEIGLYASTGAFATGVVGTSSDDDDGSGTLSQLTYGNVTPRIAVGDGVAYNGRDGALAAGTYYLALGAGPASTFATGFAAVSTSAFIGPYQIRVRLCDNVPTGACCLPSGACTPLTHLACVNLNGGIYQGDGVACGTCTAPTAISLTNCVTSTASGSLAAGEVDWYSITIPAVATPGYLDIDSEGSALTPTNNTEIGLYNATTGALATGAAATSSDDDDGSDLLSQLSYGNTTARMPFGNSVAYNGRDGAAVAAGTYLLAVAGFNSTFGTTLFNATSPSTFTGPYQVRVRVCDTAPATGACCRGDGVCVDTFTQFLCVVSNAGVYHGDGVLCSTVTCASQPTAISLTNCVTATASGTLAAGQVAWYSITVPALAGTMHLDIDTEGSALTPTNNTEIGLYTAAVLEDTDDDDGSNTLSQLSYGNAAQPRMPFGNSVAYNGRDGATLTAGAGTYYLAVAGFNSVFNATGFNVTSPSTFIGPYQIRVRLCDTQPTGACCRGDGSCVDIAQGACVLLNGGVYQGDSVLCTAVTCTQPTVITLPTCGSVAVNGTLAAGQVRWYSLTVPAIATPAYLDIDTEGTVLAPTNDTEIGLYASTGAFATGAAATSTDDDDGTPAGIGLSQLSYGNVTPRPAYGSGGVAYNGRDGALVAGTYYLAVGGFNTEFLAPNFGASSTSTFAGTFQVRVNTCGSVPTGACCITTPGCTDAVTQAVCLSTLNGVWKGGGTTCAAVTCPMPATVYCNLPFDLTASTQSGVAAPVGYMWSEMANNTSQLTVANTAAGFLADPEQFARMADNFTVGAGGWNVDFFKVPLFQSAGTTTSPSFNHATLRIWNGPPNVGSSSVVWGDTSTNRLVGTSRMNAYRIFNTIVPPTCGTTATTAPVTTNPLYEAFLEVGTTLAPGSYWADWGVTGSIAAGPWAPTTTATGNRRPNGPGSNAMQFFGGAWAAVTDAGQGCSPAAMTQDLHFCFLGTEIPPPATCYPNCDGSTILPCLNVQDFGCFLNEFAAGETYANCDLSTLPPVLNVQDFGCYLNAFGSGCSSC